MGSDSRVNRQSHVCCSSAQKWLCRCTLNRWLPTHVADAQQTSPQAWCMRSQARVPSPGNTMSQDGATGYRPGCYPHELPISDFCRLGVQCKTISVTKTSCVTQPMRSLVSVIPRPVSASLTPGTLHRYTWPHMPALIEAARSFSRNQTKGRRMR